MSGKIFTQSCCTCLLMYYLLSIALYQCWAFNLLLEDTKALSLLLPRQTDGRVIYPLIYPLHCFPPNCQRGTTTTTARRVVTGKCVSDALLQVFPFNGGVQRKHCYIRFTIYVLGDWRNVVSPSILNNTWPPPHKSTVGWLVAGTR